MTNSLALVGPPRSGIDSKPYHFPRIFEERLLWKLRKPLSKKCLNDIEFLIFQEMRTSDFL